MGVIDSNKFEVTCPQCKIYEIACVLEKGGAFSSSWDSPSPMIHFETKWSDGRSPMLAMAKCKKCGAKADIKLIF